MRSVVPWQSLVLKMGRTSNTNIRLFRKMKSTQRRREVWQYLLGHLDWTDSVEKIQMRESRFYDKKLIEVIICKIQSQTMILHCSYGHSNIFQKYQKRPRIMILMVFLEGMKMFRLQSEYEAQISEWGALEAIVLQQDR